MRTLTPVLLLAVIVCGSVPSAFADSKDSKPSNHGEIRQMMLRAFGSPGPVGFQKLQTISVLQGDQASRLREAKQLMQGRAVYQKHCASCHGNDGDGQGTRAKELSPRPRDFRLGRFKFTSTIHVGYLKKPVLHDLKETVRVGLPGTAMPGFPKMSAVSRIAVAKYVRWLAIRGEIEHRLRIIAKFEEETPSVERFNQIVNRILHAWEACELETNILRPKLVKLNGKRVARGQILFGKWCAMCHGAKADGRGPATKRVHRSFRLGFDRRQVRKPGLYDFWGHLNQPRDLNSGSLRGGSQPQELFRRIATGINGTEMVAKWFPQKKLLSEDEIWDLVAYVKSISTDGPAKLKRSEPPQGRKGPIVRPTLLFLKEEQ